MRVFDLVGRADAPLRVLALGAHCDDIEIGCGGTLHALTARPGGLDLHYEIFSSTPGRRVETEAAAQRLFGAARSLRTVVGEFRESFFPHEGDRIKERFEAIRGEFAPDVVLTHRRDDRHQDHRVLSDLAWNTFRDHLVLEYEIPKWDGDLGQPNLYVPLASAVVEAKIAAVMACFGTQAGKGWFDEDTFRGLMRLRGMECNAPDRFAEAFHARKLAIGWGMG